MDPDLPEQNTPFQRAHAWIGRTVINARAMIKRPVSLGVRLLALSGRNEVLLVRHSYMPGHSLPGGAVDEGEACRQAVLREAVEEACLEFEGQPTLFHIYLNPGLKNRDHVALFVARDARQAAPPRPNPEILSAGFFALDALPPDTTAATKTRLAEVLESKDVSDVW